MIHTVYLSQTISFYINPSLSLSIYLSRSLLKRATRVRVSESECECESECFCVCQFVSV